MRHGARRPAAACGHHRRIRRHAGEQRRPRTAILPDLSASGGSTRELAMAARFFMGIARRRVGSDGRRSAAACSRTRCRAVCRSSASPEPKCRASRIVTAAAPPKRPTSAWLSPSRPRTPTRRSPTRWRAHGAAARRAATVLLDSRLELHPGRQQIPERDRRRAARRRSRRPAVSSHHQPVIFGAIPALRSASSEWLVLPHPAIFGSEELSAHAPGIAELAPEPYLAVNAADAAKLQMNLNLKLKSNLAERPTGFR